MTLRFAVALLLLACAVAAGAQQGGEPVGGVYTCVDAHGRKLTADRPIAECTDREQRVLNPSGTVRQVVGPTLTAQERAKLEAKARQEQDERNRQLDEKRRDKALLVRFPNQAAHEAERVDALAQIAAVSKAASNRLNELEAQRKKLDTEMEFYKKDPRKAPEYLQRQVEDNKQSTAIQKRFIAEQEEEVRKVNRRFDDELERLRVLWAQQALVPP